MVAAWIKAETGVGPSIASGSQTCSGTWADLPTAPRKSPIPASGEERPGELAARDAGEDVRVGEVADLPGDDQDADEHPQVADPGGEEGLLRGVRRRMLLEPESDQEVRGEPDQLPEDVERNQVVGEDEPQHREREEREIGEEAGVPRIAVHVAHREEVDHRAHQGHDHQHADGELIDQDPHRDVEGSETQVVDLAHEGQGIAAAAHDGRGEELGREHECGEDRPDRDEVPLPRQPPADGNLDHECGERQ